MASLFWPIWSFFPLKFPSKLARRTMVTFLYENRIHSKKNEVFNYILPDNSFPVIGETTLNFFIISAISCLLYPSNFTTISAHSAWTNGILKVFKLVRMCSFNLLNNRVRLGYIRRLIVISRWKWIPFNELIQADQSALTDAKYHTQCRMYQQD